MITDYERKAHTPIRHQPMTYRQAWAHGLYALRDKERYGDTPAPVKTPLPPDMLRLKAKLDDLRAGQNVLENRVNGLMKMGHTHSKKVSKYSTYSLEDSAP
ncbi:hypothetical protein M0R72_13260 [Candidatus Pacearchaeota archaeon]|jgi:hypothetical protein|nr:hypothetical protein [Candidatus Pacearchaeota archaeon]